MIYKDCDGLLPQLTHWARIKAYLVGFYLYIILLKRREEKFRSVLRSFILLKNGR